MFTRLPRTAKQRSASMVPVALAGLMGLIAASSVADPDRPKPGGINAAAADFTGVVTDKQTGRPIPDAIVSLEYAHPRVGTSPFCPSCYPDCQKREHSDKTGHFRIAAPDKALLFTVLVVRPGYEPRFFGDVDPSRGVASFALTRKPLRKADPRSMVQGRVVRPDGRPLGGAILETNGVGRGDTKMFGNDDQTEPMVVTESDGSFVFHLSKDHDEVLLQVQSPGLAPRLSGWLKSGKPPVRLVLGVGASLTGSVTAPSGKRLAGVVFEAVQTDLNSESFVGAHYIGTNTDGGFALPNVPANVSHTVCIHSEGALAQADLAVLQRSVTTPDNGKTVDFGTFQAIPAATLQGKLLTPSGTHLPAGTRILLGRDATWDAQEVVVAPDGTFAFHGIPPGEPMTVTIRPEGYHLAKGTKGLDKDNPLFGNVHFVAPSAGVLPEMTLVLQKDVRKP